MPHELSLVIFHRVYLVAFIERLFPNRTYKRTLLFLALTPYKSRTKRGEDHEHFEWSSRSSVCRNPDKAAVNGQTCRLCLLLQLHCADEVILFSGFKSVLISKMVFAPALINWEDLYPQILQVDLSKVYLNWGNVEAQRFFLFYFFF